MGKGRVGGGGWGSMGRGRVGEGGWEGNWNVLFQSIQCGLTGLVYDRYIIQHLGRGSSDCICIFMLYLQELMHSLSQYEYDYGHVSQIMKLKMFSSKLYNFIEL